MVVETQRKVVNAVVVKEVAEVNQTEVER